MEGKLSSPHFLTAAATASLGSGAYPLTGSKLCAQCLADLTVYNSCFQAPMLLSCKMDACCFNMIEDNPTPEKADPHVTFSRKTLPGGPLFTSADGAHGLHLILANVNDSESNEKL